MITLELYTLADAQREKTLTPTEASIMKWTAIIDALRKIRGVIGTYCGLCLAYHDCKGCPLGSCSKAHSPYEDAYNRTGDALVEAQAMLAYIQEKTEDKK